MDNNIFDIGWICAIIVATSLMIGIWSFRHDFKKCFQTKDDNNIKEEANEIAMESSKEDKEKDLQEAQAEKPCPSRYARRKRD